MIIKNVPSGGFLSSLHHCAPKICLEHGQLRIDHACKHPTLHVDCKQREQKLESRAFQPALRGEAHAKRCRALFGLFGFEVLVAGAGASGAAVACTAVRGAEQRARRGAGAGAHGQGAGVHHHRAVQRRRGVYHQRLCRSCARCRGAHLPHPPCACA